jgi:hypothetical protein
MGIFEEWREFLLGQVCVDAARFLDVDEEIAI